MRVSVRPTVPSQWQLLTRSSIRQLNTGPPPTREYKQAKLAKPRTPSVQELVPESKPGFLSRFFPKRERQPLIEGPQDPQRGYEAARKVVKEGVLDSRYKNAGKVYTRLIVALPIAIYLSYELYRRRFLGGEQKAIPQKQVKVEQEEVKTKEKDVW